MTRTIGYYVDVLEEATLAKKGISTVEEAIEVYMEAFRQKFHSQDNRKQRRICLQYFQRYLTKQGHSMKLKDLTLVDGQSFLDSLTNHYNCLPLRPSEVRKYRSGLRSFSRFLHLSRIILENVFLAVK
jgi:site-specific recombinase XerD